MSEDKVELLEFHDGYFSVNIFLDDDGLGELRRVWGDLKGVQMPLIDASRDGLIIHIPWMTKGESDN